MAKIPKYIRQERPQVVPGVRVSPEAMTQDLQAMSQFGETLSKVGNEFLRELTQAEEVSQLSNASTIYDTELNARLLEYGKEKETDEVKAAEWYAKNEKEIRESAGALVTQPRAYNAFIRAANEGNVLRKKVFDSSINQNRIKKIEDETEFSLNSIVTNMVDTGSTDMTAYDVRMKDAIKTNVYNEGEAGSLRLAAKEKIKAGIKNMEITQSLVDLKTRYIETPGYKSEYGEGITGAINEVESAKYLKENGEEKQRTVLSSLVQQQARRDREYKDFSDKKVGDASVKIYNNEPLTASDVEGLEPPERALIERIEDYQGRQNRAEVNYAAQEKRAASAERRAKRYEEKIIEQEKSSAIAADIRAKILNNEPIDITTDIYGKVKKDGLIMSDANQLNGMLSKVQKDPKYTLGADVIKKGVFDAAQRGRMLLDFYAKVNEEQATGKRVIEIAEELVNPVKENHIKALLMRIGGNMMKGDYYSITGRLYSTTKSKTVTIDGKEYSDGDIYVKNGKKSIVRVP